MNLPASSCTKWQSVQGSAVDADSHPYISAAASAQLPDLRKKIEGRRLESDAQIIVIPARLP
jgi:hypothetical protein